MAVTQTEITKLASRLAANIKLKSDYKAFVNKQRKLLIVEGSTDAMFVGRVKRDAVECVSAIKIFRSNDAFRTTPTTSKINCKDAIVTLIRGVSHFPSPFFKYPDDIDKWDIYGLVDLDCDELARGKPTPRLFVTDTHDLETLLLSTDNDVLQNIDLCRIPSEDVKTALYMAYQLAFARSLLFSHYVGADFQISTIACGSRWVKFGQFFSNNRIDLFSLVRHIANESGGSLSEAKVQKICTNVLGSKHGKKKFTKEGIWKYDLSEFDSSAVEDFWQFVNGHDILQLLGYLNERVCVAFYQDQKNEINRAFEIVLVGAYDPKNFKKTVLYQKMEEANIVLPIE